MRALCSTRSVRRLVYTLRDIDLVEPGLDSHRKRYYVARALRKLGLALLLAPMSDRPEAFRAYEAMRAHVADVGNAHRAAMVPGASCGSTPAEQRSRRYAARR